MRAITETEIERLRMEVKPLFSDTCSIGRRSTVPDEQGGMTDGLTTIASMIPCRVDPTLWRRPTIFNIANSQANVDPIIITLPYDTDIKSNDYIVTDSDGQGFEVLGLINDPTWIVTKQVAVIRSI